MTSRPEIMEDSLDRCLDRGEEYVNNANNQELWQDRLLEVDKALDEVERKFSTEKQIKESAEDRITQRIDAAESKTIDEDKNIVHPQALRRAMTPELVLEVLACYKSYADKTQRKEAASKLISSYCKIFAILLRFSKGEYIKSFIDQNIDDSKLPLNGEPKDGKSISWAKHEWANFLHWQWTFLPPFFARPEGRVLHYVLKRDDILPITEKEDYKTEDKDTREDDDSSDTDKLIQIKRFQPVYGGNSTVSKIKFDPLSCDFGEFRFQHRDGWFAWKQLTGHFTRKDFLSEVYVWKLFNSKGNDRLHLSPLLCTFEKAVHGGRIEYSLLFPWASGDLRQLWENNSNIDDRFTAGWMAEQCSRIAEALSVIHQDREERNQINADGSDEELYGRHGDIKPANILWFAEHIGCKDAGTLMLADFGISKCHRSMTKSLSDPEKTKNSPTYKSPEFDSKGLLKIGRKSDIWGLACTWIEFVTWYLRGWRAVDVEFPNRRDETDPNDENVSHDTYFSISGVVPIIKPGVVQWMKELHDDKCCSDFIHDFLSFIQEKMLLVDPVARATASDVSLKMKEFSEKIDSDSEYANPTSSR